MAMRWIEGFETDRHDTYMGRKYRVYENIDSLNNLGDKAGYALKCNADGKLYTKTLVAADEDIWVVGFRTRIEVNTGAGTPGTDEYVGINFFTNTDGSPGPIAQCSLILIRATNNSYKWQLVRGEIRDSNVIGTSPAFWAGKWHYFEIKVTIKSTGGAYELRQDGTNILSGSTVDLAAHTSDGADSVGFRIDPEFADTPNAFLDDIYILDSTGSANNDFLGDGQVRGCLPNEDGSRSEWSPSTGSDHYAMVDDPEVTPNDGDFVSSVTNGDRDLWGYAAITKIISPVAAIQINTIASMQTSGSKDIKHFMKSAGVEADGSKTFTLDTVEWDCLSEIVEEDPGPSPDTAWDADAINTAEFGVKTAS